MSSTPPPAPPSEPGPGHGLAGWALARIRTLVTLGVLGALLVFGVLWGFAAATKPFPERLPTPACVDRTVSEGDPVRPAAVTVSVLNAGDQSGLASQTMGGLVEAGFDRGEQGNAEEDVDVDTVQIWSDDRRSPAARLLKTYLGGKDVRVLERADETDVPGIVVVVGDDFGGVQEGRGEIVADSSATVCGPPELS